MAKLSFMKFYPYDWFNDTMILSAEARGCWINLICLMWNAHEKGEWSGSYEEFARVTGIPWESSQRIISELAKVATVTNRNNEVTLTCRRIKKEDLKHKDNAKRQSAFRERQMSNKIVTDKTLDVRLLKTLDSQDNNKKKTTPSAPPKIGAGDPFWKSMIDHMDKTWTQKKHGAKYPWTGKDFKHLKRLSGIYEVWGVMALWDIYLRSGDDWASKHGYDVVTFAGQIPKLLDDYGWKQASKVYEDKLDPPNLEARKELISMMGSKEMTHV